MSSVAQLCSPALVYLVFSLIHVLVDMYKQHFDSAFLKIIMMIIITMLLNILCERGLSIISWIIVLIPIMMMTFTMVLWVYFLGFKPGQLNKVFNIDSREGYTSKLSIEQRLKNLNL